MICLISKFKSSKLICLPDGRGPPIFANFIKKWGKLYKKISSVYPIFKIQFIYTLILYVIFKKFFRIDENNKQIRLFL